MPHDTTVIVERRVTIGRARDTDLQLSDPEVSRRHAKVEVGLDGARCC
ncbi:MAG: FHA domain-containing protein [Nannocystaceae bacterium]